MENKTRSITEGAMMIALIAVFLLLNRQFANALEFFIYFLSVPIAVYTHRHGVSMGTLVSLSTVLVAFMFSGFTTTFYMITAVLCGLFYGVGTKKKWKNKILLFGLVIINVISTYLEVIALSAVFGYDINEEVQYMLDMFGNIYQGTMDITQYVLTIVILSYVATAVLQAIAIHMVSYVVMVRLKLDVLPLQSIRNFTFPRYCAFFVVMSFFGYYYSASHTLSNVANNTLLAFYCIGNMMALVQGCVAILCMKQRRSFFSFFIIMLMCFIPLINTFIAMFGLFDMALQKRIMIMNEGGNR